MLLDLEGCGTQVLQPEGGFCLHDYQVRAIELIEKEIAAGRKRILLVSPTGSGKTVIARELIRRANEAGESVMFVAHREEIVAQTHQKLRELGVPHGVIKRGWVPNPMSMVQICGIQTLYRRVVGDGRLEMPRATWLFIDEAHHAVARTWREIIKRLPNAILIGLTATPCRGDGRGLGDVFESLIEVAGVRDLIGKTLVSAVTYAPSRPNLLGVHVRAGDYVESELAERLDKPKLIGDVVENWFKYGERRRTVVFAINTSHARHLRDEFRINDVMSEYIDGKTPADERQEILNDLRSGVAEVVVNCMVLTEGWDCPEVSCIILARPTKSLGLYRQMVGRVLRTAPGKKDAIIIDHAGAVFHHDFFDAPIKWQLRPEERSVILNEHTRMTNGDLRGITQCPECGAVRREGKPCPACGWRHQPAPKPVAVIDGELGKVERDGSVTRRNYTEDDRRSIYAQLLWIAQSRHYKPAWAAVNFKEKFGEWPPHKWSNNLRSKEPTREVLAWVRAKAKAYAKRRANDQHA